MNRDREAVWQAWLRDGPERGSDAKLERIFEVTRTTSQRTPWTAIEWWLPNVSPLAESARLLVFVALVLLLLLAFVFAFAGSRPPLPRPIGPAANGALAVDQNGTILLVNVDGSGSHPVVGGQGSNHQPHFSPDGSHLVFWSHPADGTPIFALYVARADGTGVRKISGELAVETHPGFTPSWSPDSSRVVFASETDLDGVLYDGPSVLYVVDVDGSADPVRITPGNAQDHSPAWSPDGNWIAYGSDTGSENVLAVVRPDGSGKRILDRQPITHGADEAAFAETISWTSDSRKVAYVRGADASNADESRFAAYLVSTDLNGDEQVLRQESSGWSALPFWSPDGRLLAFDTAEIRNAIFVVQPDGSGLRMVGACDKASGLTWSPDGKLLVATCANSNTVIPIDDPSAAFPAAVPDGAAVTDWQRVAP